MIVDDFGIENFAVLPHEAHAPLLVNADAVLPITVALKCLELIAGRHGQVAKSRGRVEVLEFFARTLLNLSVDPLHELAAKNSLRPLVLKRTDHPTIVT